MATVTVSINGVSYRIACGPGEEDRVSTLADFIDVKARELSASVGHVGESLILVMVGLMLADELSDTRAELDELRVALGEAKDEDGPRAREQAEERVAHAIEIIAERIDRIAGDLQASG